MRSGKASTQPPYTEPPPAVTEAAASQRSNAIGKNAPAFELVDQNDKSVKLNEFRGQWLVIYFYPKDDTPGCTCEANEFTALLQKFGQVHANVVGINADTPADHRQFIKEYNLKVRFLSDPQRGALRAYGAWVYIPQGINAPGMFLRSTFLIDPTGKIAWHWPEVVPQGHAQRVYEKLIELSKS